MEHEIRLTEKKVSEHLPRVFYKTEYRGQANFLLRRLEEEKVQACFSMGNVAIFGKTKTPKLIELIKESFTFVEKEAPNIESKCLKVQKDMGLICVLLDQAKRVFVTQNHVSDLEYSIYKREIPLPKFYKIFRTKRDMLQTLEEAEGYLV